MPVRRPLFALALMLLAAGCAAPRSAVVEAADAQSGTVHSTAQELGQELAQQPGPAMAPSRGQVAQAGLTSLLLPPALPRARPAVVRGPRPLECVPYAREISGIRLRGNAWTWWTRADGHYPRGAIPRPGAVLVFSKTRRLRLGHLAVVAEVRNSREIVVHQANWLNGGRIHRYTPVRDVSKDNDWSAVRVWYTPGRTYGARTYAAYGFIYQKPQPRPDLRQAAN